MCCYGSHPLGVYTSTNGSLRCNNPTSRATAIARRAEEIRPSEEEQPDKAIFEEVYAPFEIK